MSTTPSSTPLPQVVQQGCASDPCNCASAAERASSASVSVVLAVHKAEPTPAVALSALKTGQTGVIADSNLSEDDGKLLRAMGLAPGRRVVMCRTGEPCIVAVVSGHHHASNPGADAQGCRCAARIGLARPLAEKIMVSMVTVGASGEPSRGV
ncbi:MAG: ferrous iron transport protein A [Phycisphaerales bacterium]|nr:ferrous iron transport protein A [Phycisphaerales bacterium]